MRHSRSGEGTDARSAVDIFVRDLGIVIEAARAAPLPAQLAAVALEISRGASAAGFGTPHDRQAVRFCEQLGGRPVRSLRGPAT